MRPSEARKIGELMSRFDTATLSPCLNLGSSTLSFRTQTQPHIERHIFKPLYERGVRVIHADIKAAEGVDLVGDIFEPTTLAAIQSMAPMSVLCCNMLEHVTDREALASRIATILPIGGLLIATVPYSYPIHHDPIDTYYRPTPEKIIELFRELRPIEGGVVSDSTYLEDLMGGEGATETTMQYFRNTMSALLFWRRSRGRLGYFHRYLWMFRPYRISYVVMKKN